MLNFLFAFDENYNIQGCVSIYSLLENLDEKANFYIILDSTNKDFIFPDLIKHHRNLNQLIIKEINTSEKFYNVDASHVSKATFYRLYISSLFSNEDIKLMYLDADIVCISNPKNEINSIFKSMDVENKAVAFADEFYRHQNSEPFIRLEMKGEKYFNAGVMVVNLKKWKAMKYSEKSQELIKELKNKAQFWDQDVLNSLIDGDYLTIDNNLNYRTAGLGTQNNLHGIKFVHYSGKSKPWDVGGIFEESGLVYHNYYKSLFGKKYHVTSNNRKNSSRKLIKRLKFYYLISFSDFVKYIFKSMFVIIKK
jgi:lipopolysaccharide biosynthesis glycosyltransferase